MEKKGNVIVVLLFVLIGIVFGIGVLIAINGAVFNALRPVRTSIYAIESSEYRIEKQLNTTGNAGNSVSFVEIQRELAQIQNRLNGIGGNAQPQMPPPEDMNKVYNIPAGISTIIGKPDAPVTIVEFSDFQCPFCARFYPVVKNVLTMYPNQVRLIVKNFPLPFHPNALPAAKLALAANEQGKFQGMMESLLVNGGDVSDAKIKEYAKNLGLDYNKLMADYKNKDAQWDKEIQNDMQLAMSVDVRGTPTFYLNGRKTRARDINSFKTEIDAILAGHK